jgi:hypothetical protein
VLETGLDGFVAEQPPDGRQHGRDGSLQPARQRGQLDLVLELVRQHTKPERVSRHAEPADLALPGEREELLEPILDPQRRPELDDRLELPRAVVPEPVRNACRDDGALSCSDGQPVPANFRRAFSVGPPRPVRPLGPA